MIKKSLICVMLFVSWLVAATGDIKSVTVLGPSDYSSIFNGWAIEIGVEGLSTGGTYALGMGTNNDPATAKIVGEILGWEFNSSNTAEQTLELAVYGTKEARKPYPNNAVMYETAATTDPDGYDGVKIIVALSEYVYAGDSISGSIAAGLYTQGGNASLAFADGAWTNNSTLTCPKAIANWSWPGYQRFTGDITLRAVGFHGSASGGKALKQINFYLVSSGAEGSTASKSVTAATIDSTMPDENPVIEYVATWTAAELAAMGIPFEDATFTADFEAIPLRTDSAGNGKLETDDGVNTAVDWRYKSQIHLYDSGGSYGAAVAVVDPDAANDTSGTVGTDYAAVTPYKYIATAIRGICSYNLTNKSRKDAGGATVYLKAGTHAGYGSYTFFPSVVSSATWCTIRPYPGQTKATVTIVPDATTNNRQLHSNKIRFIDINFTRSSGLDWLRGTLFAGADYTLAWFDDCTLNGSGSDWSGAWTYNTRRIVTHSALTLSASMGVGADLLRGCTVTGGNSIGTFSTAIGNRFYNPANNAAHLLTNSSDAGDSVANGIAAFNKWLNQEKNIITLGIGTPAGIAIVQNVLERTDDDGSAYTAMTLYGVETGTTTAAGSNVLLWHNTIAGHRCNMTYNAVGDASLPFAPWYERNNIYNYRAWKGDTFGTPNGARTGNWPMLYGVGTSGNVYMPAAYGIDNNGLGCLETSVSDENYAAHAAALAFVDYSAFAGAGTPGDGNGDYHLTAASPAIGLTRDWLLPYDLDGNARKAGGAAGAYEFPDTAEKAWYRPRLIYMGFN